MFKNFTVVMTCCAFATPIFGNHKSKKENKPMQYQVEAQEIPAQPALVIKGKVKVEKVGEAIGGILGKVSGYLEKKNAHPTGAPFTRTYQHEKGVLEFESGFPVQAGVMGQGEIIATELPRGKVATTVHVGFQETSEQAYKAIHIWMAKNGKKEAGAPWEVYLTDPSTTPENESKMQIYYPVR